MVKFSGNRGLTDRWIKDIYHAFCNKLNQSLSH